MSGDSQDPLEELLGNWAASREAGPQHVQRLSKQIVAAHREPIVAEAPGLPLPKSPQDENSPHGGDRPVPVPLNAAPLSHTKWGTGVMIGGGALLLCLVLGGSLLYLNLTTTPSNNGRQAVSINNSTDVIPPATVATSDCPLSASLPTAIVAAKQHLLDETNVIFDNRLAWITDGEHDVSLEVRDRDGSSGDGFMLVRVVVAQRSSSGSSWSTLWQMDVISRHEAIVEVTPEELDGLSLVLWTHQVTEDEVAVEMELLLDRRTQLQSSSSTVLRIGEPEKSRLLSGRRCRTLRFPDHSGFEGITDLTSPTRMATMIRPRSVRKRGRSVSTFRRMADESLLRRNTNDSFDGKPMATIVDGEPEGGRLRLAVKQSNPSPCHGCCLAVLFLVAGLGTNYCWADVTIHAIEQCTNEFSGREVARSFRIESSTPITGRFVWNLSVNERTLARGEQELNVTERARDVIVKLRLEPLRDEIVLPATLSVAVVVNEAEVGRKTNRLWFFADNPFQTRGKWLRSLDLKLFDPRRETEEVLQSVAFPFESITNPARIRAMQGEMLIVGSGVSMREHRRIADATLAAAAQGTRVLWLSAADGSLPMEQLESAGEVVFADAAIIQRLDKRFDSMAWCGGGMITSRLNLNAERTRVVAEIGDEGWPWLEARWPGTGGRFIYCGFALMERWDDSPTARNMLLRILERLHAEELSP